MSWIRQTGLSMALVAMLLQAAIAGISAAAASADSSAGLPGASGFIEICTRHGLRRVPVKAAPGAETPTQKKLSFSCDCTMCPVLSGGLAPPAAPAVLWAPQQAPLVLHGTVQISAIRPVQTGPPPTRAPPFPI